MIWGVPSWVWFVCFWIIIAPFILAQRGKKEIVDGTPYEHSKIHQYRDIEAFKSGRYFTLRPADINKHNEVVYKIFGDFRPVFDEVKKFFKRLYHMRYIRSIMPELGTTRFTQVIDIPRRTTFEDSPAVKQHKFLESSVDDTFEATRKDIGFVVEEVNKPVDTFIDTLINNNEVNENPTSQVQETIQVTEQELIAELAKEDEVKLILRDLIKAYQQAKDPDERNKIYQDMIDYLDTTFETTIIYLPEDILNILETFAGSSLFYWRTKDEETQKWLLCITPHREANFIKGSANEDENIIEVYSPAGYSMRTMEGDEEVHIHLGLLYPLGVPLEVFLNECKNFNRLPPALVRTFGDLLTYAKYFQQSRVNEALANFYQDLFHKFFAEHRRGKVKIATDEIYGHIQELTGFIEQHIEKPLPFKRKQEKQVGGEGVLRTLWHKLTRKKPEVESQVVETDERNT